MDFYCVFVRTEINLIAFSGPRNCVNTQYAALSGAMYTHHKQVCGGINTHQKVAEGGGYKY